MGLLARIRQLVRRFRAPVHRRQESDEYRRCRFEAMESRRMMDADPIRVGAVYIEEDAGADLHGDTFEITFVGGSADTQLTRVVIDGDQDAPGFSTGDVFFDTQDSGFGADHGGPFEIRSLQTKDPQATVIASVLDGTTRLTLDFKGFQAGDKLVFSIDVDEVEDFNPAETNLSVINEGFDPITSGVEFQGSKITAYFSAPHYYDASGTAEFRNRYDDAFVGSGLNLPADDFQGKRDRSDGAIVNLTQAPLPIAISGQVYLESDLDLEQDNGEPGIRDVELALWRKHGDSYTSTGFTTRTDSEGRYEFGTALGLLPGTYQVRETQPTGLFSVGAIPGSVEGATSGTTVAGDRDLLTEIAIPLGGQHSIRNDFAEAEPASISGYVYHDRSNDGMRDRGEEGLSGVTIQVIPLNTIAAQAISTVQTNSSGFYEATGLAPGSYRLVELSQPTNYFDGIDKPGTVNGITAGSVTNPGDSLEQILLRGGESGVNYNFGELAPASLAGRVGLTDKHGNCEGIAFRAVRDALVRLLDSAGTVIAETRTNDGGEYEFTGLHPGQYSVVEFTPEGLIDGDAHPGTVAGGRRGQAGTGTITQIVLGSGQNGIDYDFCEYEPSSVSGYVYHDENDNGVFDGNETPIQDAVLMLRDANGTTLATRETDSQGFYEFAGLSAGSYVVVEAQPSGWLDGKDAAGTVSGQAVGQAANPGDRISGVALLWGEDSVRNDFGELLPGSITGQVHLDRNGNCELDEGESTLAGVTIELLDAHGNRLQSQVTGADGRYQFNGLTPGTYGIREIQPDGVFQGGQTAGSHGGDDSLRDLITNIQVGSGQFLVQYDFCEVPPASLAGMVFADPNSDCEFNAGDTALAGVTVQLLNDQDQVVATTSTDSHGRYKFENLAPAVYAVRELQPDGYFHGGQTAGSAGGNSFVADVIGQILVSAGEDLVEYNFCEVPPASLAGMVFADPNSDCTFNAGDSGLPGVTVQLFNDQDEVVATTTTDHNGRYQFANLAPGVYAVRETQPDAYFHGGQTAGSDGGNDQFADVIEHIFVSGGANLVDYNFCELPPARISGNVFVDGAPIRSALQELSPQEIGLLRDGKHTSDDVPLAGVTLQLRDGLTGQPVDASEALPGLYPPGPLQTKTDADGQYQFTGIPGGRSYAIYQIHPAGFVDGIDTVGTTTGFAFNAQSLEGQFALEPLAGQPASDAIIRIAVTPGGSSDNNNFSEVVVERQAVPPVAPPLLVIFPPLPTFVPPLHQPTLATQHRLEPVLTAVSWIAPRQHVTAETLSGSIGYTWHLSVVNGGMPRDIASASNTEDAVWRSATLLDQSNWDVESMDQARWVLAVHQQSNQKQNPRTLVFGVRGGIPFTGDFNGDGISEVGIFYRGEWFVDLNGNGVWDEADLWAKLGDELDRPVVGDWDGDGKDDIGVFGPEWLGDQRQIANERGLPDSQNLNVPEGPNGPKNVPPPREAATDGQRLLRLNAQGPRRADVIDHVLRYGDETDTPVAGDWNGDGIRTVGVFRGGQWRIDVDGDGLVERGSGFRFGTAGDIPVIGDWDGNGVEEIGIYRSGKWILDVNGNRELDAHDRVFEMGGAADRPVVGDWNGDGVDEPGLYREIPPVNGPSS